jgi:signal transduction histidine kinase
MSTEKYETGELINFLSHLASMATGSDMKYILNWITSEISNFLKAAGCTIFLTYDILPDFDGSLVRGGETISLKDIADDVIVMAATSSPEIEMLEGNAFYHIGEGITGWVYKYDHALNIKDMSDQNELHRISPDLVWNDSYKNSKIYYKSQDKKPLLVIPLRTDKRIVGVMKFYSLNGDIPFTEKDKTVAALASQILTSAIINLYEVNAKQKTILCLNDMNKCEGLLEAALLASGMLVETLRCERCQVYLPNSTENAALHLVIENGKEIDSEDIYKRGEDFIGWVFKTGKSLRIDDASVFMNPVYLDDVLLAQISDGGPVNNDDRILSCLKCLDHNSQKTSYLAVPIIQDGEVLGLITTQLRYGKDSHLKLPFSNDDMALVQAVSVALTKVLEAEQEKKLEKIMIDLGFPDKPIDEYYHMINSSIPDLVSSAGCSIYKYKKEARRQYLRLVNTSRAGLVRNNEVVNLEFNIGQEKIGFCGEVRASLIINHYGSGIASEIKMEQELERIKEEHENDLTAPLLDVEGLQVGIIQLRHHEKNADELHLKFNESTQRRFADFAKEQVLVEYGLNSKVMKPLYSVDVKPPWSFAAIPITWQGELFGVISVGRAIPENPLSHHDITVIESIAGRIASVEGNLNMQEQRRELLMSLAHEINTPITGIIAESENLMNMLANQPTLHEIAKRNLEQGQRLHMLSETIMGVLPEPGQKAEMKFINIGDLLSEARSMFLYEAELKGCFIRPPRPVGEDAFPLIEMAGFQMAIAIKNILHNAVKYSFSPSKINYQGNRKKRYISIWGIWTDSSHQVYSVSIQDYGVGISPQEINQRLIFQPFYRGKNAIDRQRTGAGFGLSYASRIIEIMHKGRIDVTSVPGEGGEGHLTTVTIYLPAYQSSRPDTNVKVSRA